MIDGRIIAIDARMIEMSGIGTYIQHLMNQGIYDIAIGNKKEIRKYDKNVAIIPFDASIYGIKEQIAFPQKKLKNMNVEIVHFPHYNVPYFYQGEIVVTVHDLTHIILPEMLGSKIKYLYAKTLMGNALRKASHIFTVSENSKNDIKKYFNIGKKEISVTYNAIDNSFCQKPKKSILYLYDKFGIPCNKKIILYIGNLKPHKNIKSLFQAYKKCKCYKDSIIVLAGKAFSSVNIKEIEIEYGILGKVFYTGIISHKDLVNLYNLSDLFVFPSLYEGFGIPPLEAMACGLPVICSNTSSLPEVVGDAALQFDPYNIDEITYSIDKVLGSEKVQQELLKKGLERCHFFKWDDSVKTIRETLQGLRKK